MNPQTWVASGHLGGFADPLMDCKACKERFRADKLIEDWAADNNFTLESAVDAWSNEEMENFIKEKKLPVLHVAKRLYRNQTVQPYVQDIPGRNRRC